MSVEWRFDCRSPTTPETRSRERATPVRRAGPRKHASTSPLRARAHHLGSARVCTTLTAERGTVDDTDGVPDDTDTLVPQCSGPAQAAPDRRLQRDADPRRGRPLPHSGEPDRRFGVNPITESGRSAHWSEQCDRAGTGRGRAHASPGGALSARSRRERPPRRSAPGERRGGGAAHRTDVLGPVQRRDAYVEKLRVSPKRECGRFCGRVMEQVGN